MPKYSKSHERDEVRLMNKGFFRSLIALILCWLPVIGLLFAISGFWRMAVRVTQAHRARRTLLTVFSVVVLILCVGVLSYEGYEYVQNPGIVSEITQRAWKAMTGQDTPPWQTPSYAGGDYSDYGFDPYAGDPDDPDYDENATDYDFDYEPDADYDADFDESELHGFEEDDSVDQEARDLLDQMIEQRRTPSSVLPVG